MTERCSTDCTKMNPPPPSGNQIDPKATAGTSGDLKIGGFASRVVGRVFQGSNTVTFSAGVNTLYTITAVPATGWLATVTISNTTAFRYVTYLGPADSYGNIAELVFAG